MGYPEVDGISGDLLVVKFCVTKLNQVPYRLFVSASLSSVIES